VDAYRFRFGLVNINPIKASSLKNLAISGRRQFSSRDTPEGGKLATGCLRPRRNALADSPFFYFSRRSSILDPRLDPKRLAARSRDANGETASIPLRPFRERDDDEDEERARVA